MSDDRLHFTNNQVMMNRKLLQVGQLYDTSVKLKTSLSRVALKVLPVAL